jgi:hypothetical protein
VPDDDLDKIRAAVARKDDELRKAALDDAAEQQQEMAAAQRKEALIQDFRLKLATEVTQAFDQARTALSQGYHLNRSAGTLAQRDVIGMAGAVLIDGAVYALKNPHAAVSALFTIALLDNGQVQLIGKGVSKAPVNIPLSDLRMPLVLTEVSKFIVTVLAASTDRR